MNKFLPRNINNSSGFTLIELMVVISIIAILAVIGIAVFANAQSTARDGQRNSELNSIAKSIEGAKNYGTSGTVGTYFYDGTAAGNDFPKTNGVPVDPTASTRGYCISTSTTSTPPAAATGQGASATCALLSGGGTYKDLTTSITTNSTGNLGFTTPDVKAWTICAILERTTKPLCVSSLTK